MAKENYEPPVGEIVATIREMKDKPAVYVYLMLYGGEVYCGFYKRNTEKGNFAGKAYLDKLGAERDPDTPSHLVFTLFDADEGKNYDFTVSITRNRDADYEKLYYGFVYANRKFGSMSGRVFPAKAQEQTTVKDTGGDDILF